MGPHELRQESQHKSECLKLETFCSVIQALHNLQKGGIASSVCQLLSASLDLSMVYVKSPLPFPHVSG